MGGIGLGAASSHLRLEGLLVELALSRLRLLHHLVHEASPAAAQLAVGVVPERVEGAPGVGDRGTVSAARRCPIAADAVARRPGLPGAKPSMASTPEIMPTS